MKLRVLGVVVIAEVLVSLACDRPAAAVGAVGETAPPPVATLPAGQAAGPTPLALASGDEPTALASPAPAPARHHSAFHPLRIRHRAPRPR